MESQGSITMEKILKQVYDVHRSVLSETSVSLAKYKTINARLVERTRQLQAERANLLSENKHLQLAISSNKNRSGSCCEVIRDSLETVITSYKQLLQEKDNRIRQLEEELRRRRGNTHLDSLECTPDRPSSSSVTGVFRTEQDVPEQSPDSTSLPTPDVKQVSKVKQNPKVTPDNHDDESSQGNQHSTHSTTSTTSQRSSRSTKSFSFKHDKKSPPSHTSQFGGEKDVSMATRVSGNHDDDDDLEDLVFDEALEMVDAGKSRLQMRRNKRSRFSEDISPEAKRHRQTSPSYSNTSPNTTTSDVDKHSKTSPRVFVPDTCRLDDSFAAKPCPSVAGQKEISKSEKSKTNKKKSEKEKAKSMKEKQKEKEKAKQKEKRKQAQEFSMMVVPETLAIDADIEYMDDEENESDSDDDDDGDDVGAVPYVKVGAIAKKKDKPEMCDKMGALAKQKYKPDMSDIKETSVGNGGSKSTEVKENLKRKQDAVCKTKTGVRQKDQAKSVRNDRNHFPMATSEDLDETAPVSSRSSQVGKNRKCETKKPRAVLEGSNMAEEPEDKCEDFDHKADETDGIQYSLRSILNSPGSENDDSAGEDQIIREPISHRTLNLSSSSICLDSDDDDDDDLEDTLKNDSQSLRSRGFSSSHIDRMKEINEMFETPEKNSDKNDNTRENKKREKVETPKKNKDKKEGAYKSKNIMFETPEKDKKKSGTTDERKDMMKKKPLFKKTVPHVDTDQETILRRSPRKHKTKVYTSGPNFKRTAIFDSESPGNSASRDGSSLSGDSNAEKEPAPESQSLDMYNVVPIRNGVPVTSKVFQLKVSKGGKHGEKNTETVTGKLKKKTLQSPRKLAAAKVDRAKEALASPDVGPRSRVREVVDLCSPSTGSISDPESPLLLQNSGKNVSKYRKTNSSLTSSSSYSKEKEKKSGKTKQYQTEDPVSEIANKNSQTRQGRNPRRAAMQTTLTQVFFSPEKKKSGKKSSRENEDEDLQKALELSLQEADEQENTCQADKNGGKVKKEFSFKKPSLPSKKHGHKKAAKVVEEYDDLDETVAPETESLGVVEGGVNGSMDPAADLTMWEPDTLDDERAPIQGQTMSTLPSLDTDFCMDDLHEGQDSVQKTSTLVMEDSQDMPSTAASYKFGPRKKLGRRARTQEKENTEPKPPSPEKHGASSRPTSSSKPVPNILDDSFDRPPPKKAEPKVAHVSVVRKQDERQKLQGHSCKQCLEFYGDGNFDEEDMRHHMQKCSRHRAEYVPPDTPPHFWSVGFIDTQECVDRGYMKVEKSTNKPADPEEPRFRRRKRLEKCFKGKNETSTLEENSQDDF